MLHPDDTFTVELDDRSFEFRHGTAADWLEYERHLDVLLSSVEVEQTRAGLDLIVSRMVGDVTAEGLAARLTRAEVVQLASSLPDRASLSEIDKKKLKRSSPSSTEPSAGDVTSRADGA